MAPRAKITNALKAMKNLGYSAKTVRPVLKELLKLYESNWMLIEEDNYRVLVDAILNSEEQKAWCNELEHMNTCSENEAEEDEPLLKRSKLSIQKHEYSPSFHASTPDCSNEVENQHHGKQKMYEPNYEQHQDKDIKLKAPYVSKYFQGKGKTSSSHESLIVMEQVKETKLISDDESDEPNSLVPLPDLEKIVDESVSCHDFSEKRMITYERVPCLSPKDAYSKGKSSDSKGNHSESMNYKQSEVEKNENDAQGSPKLDIASSSRGEVKISVMANSSLMPDFHVPSLEAVLKQMEEHCLKSYGIPQTGFSMLRLMKEVCDCFLAAGTASTYTEDVRPETSPAEGTDHQLTLCGKSTISNDPIKIQNLFEVSSQIPRFVGTLQLDLSHCKIYLTVDVNRPREVERNIVELNSHVSSSSRMMIFQKQSCYLYIEDITKGQEPYEISLINEINEEGGPTFNYISQNVTYQNAYMRFLLAHISEENCCSDCSGDCLPMEIPCNCASKTGAEFAYTPGGLLKEKFLDNVISMNHSVQQHNLFYCQDCPLERPIGKNSPGKCRGHVVRNFIKECWYKCGCSMKCGNRVVQQGITPKLQVFMTHERKGWGLRTLEDVPKGAFFCEYVGEVVTIRELFERNMQHTGDKHTYPVVLDANWNSEGVLKDEKALCLDATVYGNVARFINHRCFDANLVEIPVEVETPDHHYYHLALFTTRKVNALEELTWDYGIDFNDHQHGKAFQCHCGSKFCRDCKSVKRGRSHALRLCY